jgi:predicted nucleotide-binding protein
MEALGQASGIDELISKVAVLDALAKQVQVDDFAEGAANARQLAEAYEVWFADCLSVLPGDLRQKFRFEYEGGMMQYRIKHFLADPVRPRTKILGTWKKLPSAHKGMLSYWQFPYSTYFRDPLTAQKRILLEAKAHLDRRAVPDSKPAQHDEQLEVGRDMPGPGLDNRVFVIHGRAKKARREFYVFLRAIGLRPIEWSEVLAETGKGSPHISEVLRTIMGKGLPVIVFSTPDEVAQLRPEHADDPDDHDLVPAGQARPNVIFEAGMAFATAPDHVILVELGKVRRFTDLDGIYTVQLSNDARPRKMLAQRLKDIGCPVNIDGSDWLEAGDLTPPQAPTALAHLHSGSAVPADNGEASGLALGNSTVTADHAGREHGAQDARGSESKHDNRTSGR